MRPGSPLQLSFVIPSHNEEAGIVETVCAIQAAAGSVDASFEVIVVDDSSSDRTAEFARASGARVVGVSCRKISAARNAGAAAARGDCLIFVDADTLVTGDVIRGLLGAMHAGAVGGGAAVRFDGPTPVWVKLLAPLIVRVHRATGLAKGCFLFCSRRAFEAVNGFDAGIFAGEEVVISRALRRQGDFVILHEAVLTSGRKLRTHSQWEVIGAFVRLALSRRKGLRDRSRLDLWYGPRRHDPRPVAGPEPAPAESANAVSAAATQT